MTVSVEFFVDKRMKRGLKGPAIKKALKKAEESVRKAFEATTRTWTTQVEFKSDFKPDKVTVWTNNKIYGYVNNGVPEHPIPKSGQTPMYFQRGYKAKTKPRVIGSSQGGKRGSYVWRSQVGHPGIKHPRKFDEEIKKRKQKVFEKLMIEAMEEQIF